MPPPTTGPKNLRVALIQGSKITEDRTLKKRVNVTVGQEAQNTFVVPVSNLPPTFLLFELVNNQYSLLFRPTMEGKVSLNGADLTLQQAMAQGLAKPRGDVHVLPLNDGSKGRVVLGEVSLLFQFVTPPPEPPKPELPANVKGNIFSQIDKFFFIILACSVGVHFSGASYIACQPMPVERELELDQLEDRFVKAMMPVEIKKPEKKPEVADKGDEKKEEKKPEKTAKEPEKAATSAADHKKDLQDKVASKGLLKLIGANSGGDGAFEDVLGDSKGVGDIASALNGAGGVGVASADNLGNNGIKGGGAGRAADIGGLGTNGAGKVDLGEKKEVAIKGRVEDSTPEVDSADVDRGKLTEFVRSRKRAIQGCYEKELKRNPSLKGKVTVNFSISPQGRAVNVDVEDGGLGNEAVISCIKTTVRGWVFPFKPESEVPVSYPFVFAPAS